MTRRTTERFTISSFPQQVQLDPNFAQVTWATLEHAIMEINKRNTSNLSFEQLYRYSYNMVLHKHGDYLYSRLSRLQTDHLRAVSAQICHTDPPAFLPEIQRQWSWFELSLAHIRDVLMYMDRHYVKSRGLKSVYQLGIDLFRDVVISDAVIFPRLSHALLTAIDFERNGETVDSPLMKSITRMLAQLGHTDNGASIYESVFETVFLERTRQFYSREATLYLADSTCSEYLHKASRRLYEERIRVDSYLEPQTASKVRAVTERELISKYMTKLIDMDNSGLVFMLRNDKLDDLRLMYTLFREIENGEDMLRDQLKKEVLERGTDIVNNPDLKRDPVALIEAVLQLKAKYERILNSSFTLPVVPGLAHGATVTPNTTPAFAFAPSTTTVVISSQTQNAANANTTVDAFGQQHTVGVGMGVGATSFGRTLGGAGERGPLLSSVAGNTMGSSSSGGIGSCGTNNTGGPSSSGASSSNPPGGGCASGCNNNNNALSDSNNNNNFVLLPPSSGIADKKFVSSVNDSFERFINGFKSSSEFVSLYVDKLLRKDFKGSSDDEVESILERVMTLFRFLHEKDAFQRYYQQHLTKRLLYSRASSSDAERTFLSKMKDDCGHMYTQKMQMMFNDIKLAEDAGNLFKERVNSRNTDMHGIDLNVYVLTTMSWPISQSVNVELPPSVTKCMERYQEFYFDKHVRRRLTWHAELGVADVRGRFGKDGSRVIDFVNVPAFCVCILMLFNDRNSLTYREIAEATRIPDDELVRHLQSLSMAKYKVLKRKESSLSSSSSQMNLSTTNHSSSPPPTMNPDDHFCFNDDFVSRNRRVRLQVVSARKETEAEKNQTKAKIDDDRRPIIDAVIIRIMKNRKTLEHNKLIMEVTGMMAQRYAPDPTEIKKRIESLVEREFIGRHPDKRQVYRYIS